MHAGGRAFLYLEGRIRWLPGSLLVAYRGVACSAACVSARPPLAPLRCSLCCRFVPHLITANWS